MDFIWLIPVLPGVGAALNGAFGVRYFSKRTAAAIACGAMGGALLVSLVAFVQLLGAEHREHLVTLAQWIPPIPLETASGMGAFEVPWAFRLDPLSGMMSLIVTGIGFLIHVYSVAYMDHDMRPKSRRHQKASSVVKGLTSESWEQARLGSAYHICTNKARVKLNHLHTFGL